MRAGGTGRVEGAAMTYAEDWPQGTDAAGRKLTLYVSNELPAAGAPGAARNAESAFRYARQGAVNTFYWVDGGFGYALAAEAERGELARVAAEVYRQLGPR